MRASFYRWKSKFSGMEVNEARRLKQLEEEHRQLKHIVAAQAVHPGIEGGGSKKMVGPRLRK